MSGHPRTPTLKELGVDVDIGPWLGFVAPSKTPTEIVNQLHEAIEKSLADPQVSEMMRKMLMVMTPMTTTAYQQFYMNEYDRWGKYIQSSGVSLAP